MSSGVNMQRVADAAGVSKSSVSLALRDDPRLASGTRRRIQEVAARLGYRKNPIVASLMAQLRVSHTPKFQANIALLNCSSNRTIFDLHPYGDFRRGIRERADKSGYGVEEFWTEEPGLKLSRLVEILTARSIKGLILAAALEPKRLFPENPELLRDFCVAVVGVDRSNPPLPRAASNQFRTARAAVEAAHRLGYRRPGLVVNEKLDCLLDRRLSAGFVAGVQDLPIAKGENHVNPLRWDAPDRTTLAKWLRAENPDVVITDEISVLESMRLLKIAVPQELGLIHLDWGPHLREWSGMRQNGRAVGAAAADLVIHQVTNNELGPPEHPKLVLVESEFVPGPSVKIPEGMVIGPPVARPTVGAHPSSAAIRRQPVSAV